MKKKSKWLNSLLWSSGNIGSAVIYLVTAQLTYALTESFSISAIYVGTVFLLSRVFDGITDFIAGNIIDRTHTKIGKARIYDLFMIIAWVFVIFCFRVPGNLTEIGKIIFIFVMYNMYTSVFATFSGCAETVRLKRSLDDEGRLHAVAVAGVITSIVSVAVSILMPILIATYSAQSGGWTKIVLFFAVPCSILAFIRFMFLPEQDDKNEVGTKEEKVGPIQSVKLVLSNKYAIIVLIIGLVQTLVATVSGSMPMYYFTYVYGDIAAASISGMVSAIVLLAVAFIPKLVSRWGNAKTVMYSLIIGIIASLLRYFMPTNIIWYAVCSAVSGLGGMPLTYLLQVMLIDTMQYGKWKNGVAPEGVYSSILNISRKIGGGLSAGLMGLILQMGSLPGGGFTDGSIKFLNNGFVAVGWIVAVIALIFYDLDKKMPQVNKELAECEK